MLIPVCGLNDAPSGDGDAVAPMSSTATGYTTKSPGNASGETDAVPPVGGSAASTCSWSTSTNVVEGLYGAARSSRDVSGRLPDGVTVTSTAGPSLSESGPVIVTEGKSTTSV